MGPDSFGEELAHALTAGVGAAGLTASTRAAVVLQCLLQNNTHSKQRVLSIPLESGDAILPR